MSRPGRDLRDTSAVAVAVDHPPAGLAQMKTHRGLGGVEILSPSDQAETWANVWVYTTIPSVQEILVIMAGTIGAELLRRNPDGSWPKPPIRIAGGELVLESIGFHAPLAALYRTTRLARS
ncbi:MAG: hypothetical protein ACREFJ_08205 [Acetobacteraceae bacterium]